MKSPLKDRPLRNPGESLDRQIEEYLNENILAYMLASMMMLLIAAFEWFRYYSQIPPKPWVLTIVFVLTLMLAIFKVWHGKKHLRNLKQGRDGEKVVGQYLERLRESGAQVFHDTPAVGFNLDHVVIAPSGIYVIETKTYSKPDKGEPTIVFDGENIELKGHQTKEPVVQVKAAASWLKNLLKESTGLEFSVKPVVVFPGWFVQPTAEAKNSAVWVLNPKALPAFIEKSKDQLLPDKLKMAAFHLSRYIRQFNKN